MDDGEPNLDRIARRGDGVYLAIAVARFLDRYRCRLAFKLYVAHLKKDTIPPLILFMVGAILGRPELCADAFRNHTATWVSCSWVAPEGFDPTVECLTTIPRKLFESLPHSHLWALRNLESARRCGACRLLDGQQMAALFLQHLRGDEICRCCHSDSGRAGDNHGERRCSVSLAS